MSFNRDEMIEQLKFEIEMIEKGRYFPSVRAPRENPEIFRDTISCLNVGLAEKQYPCSDCFLSVFVPPQLRESSGNVCHNIPLNAKGETIASLKALDDPYQLQQAVLSWLQNTVARLDRERDEQGAETKLSIEHVT